MQNNNIQQPNSEQSADNGTKPYAMRRFRVNVLHRGKERWKYCRTIERAKFLQRSAIDGGLSSIIYEKRGKYYGRFFTKCPSCQSENIYHDGWWTCKDCTHDWGA